MHSALTRQDHRPWPVPSHPWRWRQTWHDLLFMHWRVPSEALRAHVPEPLRIETRDGAAWLGLVPFRMTGVSLRGLPDVPWLSAFAEMNLRTYVTFGGKPGVWFLRMDAERGLAVWAARLSLGLPYLWSAMKVNRQGDAVAYRSRRQSAVFDSTYGPTGPPIEAARASLEAFLVERYCLYSRVRGRLVRMDVHHWPWPLQPAKAAVRVNSIPQSLHLPAPGHASDSVLLHFARRLDVIGWEPQVINA